MIELFGDYTFRNVLFGVTLIGFNGGLISVYLTLRKQSLVGDLVSHATLPGIVIIFLIFGVKLIFYFSLAAVIAGWLSILFVIVITHFTKMKTDTAIAINLSSFFGIGILLLSYLQKTGNDNQSGIKTFLFGQASALTEQNVNVIFVFTLVLLVLLLLFWKELKLLSFDPAFYSSVGYSILKSDLILMSFVVIVITLGIQAIGVTLMASMVIAPAAAARQWTNSLFIMAILSTLFGILAGISGTIASTFIPNLPTGPSVVVAISIIVFISIFFAPNRGYIARFIAHHHNSESIKLEYLLMDMVSLSQQHTDPDYAHTKDVLAIMTHNQKIKKKYMKRLELIGWIQENKNEKWFVTKKGHDKFQEIKHRFNAD